MSYEERLKVWEKARFAPPPEPELTPSKPTMIKMAPMRDGIRLYTEIFLPATTGSFPVILLRSPYPYSRPSRNDKRPISRYLETGYAFVFQMTRGQYKSEGTFRYLKDDVDDGYDCVKWVAAQSWCNGHIGMEGVSYLGATQLLAARTKPAALKCIMPTAFVGSPFSAFPYQGGIPYRCTLLQWYKVADAENMETLDAPIGDMSVLKHPLWGAALHKRPLIKAADGILLGDKLSSWRDMIFSSFNNDYWRSIHFTDEDLTELDLPIFFTAGWLDATMGAIDYFQRIERLQPGRTDRYLLVGPWDHYQTYAAHLHGQSHGDREMPENGAVDLIAQRLAFYDRYLKGDTGRIVQTDRVRVYITGVNVWRDFPTLPVPDRQERHLYLHSNGDARSFPGDGTLTWEAPLEETADSYVYDPGLAAPSPSDADRFNDRRWIEVRSDVLVYTSKPLQASLAILGDMELVLYAASDVLDTDWVVQITEVFADGRSIAFHGGLGTLRARYRKGFEQELFLTPNVPTKYSIPLGPAGHQVLAGNRLRLSICSAAFPMCDPNTNSGNRVATDIDIRVARQTVFHDAARPSHIVIPVVKLK